jgi:formylglycine-generating enzyme
LREAGLVRRDSAWIAALWLLGGCGDELPPLGQVVLAVDTDALLPPPPGEVLGPGESPALFDTLRVDVYEPGAREPCVGCSRTFAIDRAQVAAGRASIGLPLTSGVEGHRVRLRLFHAASTLTGDVPGEPCLGCTPTSVIETVVSLPGVGEEGIVDGHVILHTERVGFGGGTIDEPEETHEGPVGASLVGTWPHASRVDCTLTPAEGEVCIPGGAYWMGNPHAVGLGGGNDADRRRLVVLDPFFLDANELTVGAFRARVDALDPATRQALLPVPWSGTTKGEDWADYCTFTEAPGPHEDEPLVCIRWDQARAFCELRGADLPTEAQLEYAASGLEGRLFVWGSEEPDCDEAVIARYGYGLFQTGPFELEGCLPAAEPGGTEVVGSVLDPPRRDRLELAGGTVFDLVGNATEWARDVYNRQTEPCWSGGGVYRNPLCETESPADGFLHAFRLGSYAVGARQAVAAYRHGLDDSNPIYTIDLGFRCARPAK